MNAFIEKNRHLLQIYYQSARIIGWALIVFSPFGTSMAFSGESYMTKNILEFLYTLQSITLNPLILGLLLIGIAQFIHCISDTEYKPGWILKNGRIVLYAAAFIVLMDCFINYLFFSFISYSMETAKFSNLFTFFIPAAIKILILIGLGRILNRILPVIEESKAIV